MFCSRPPKTVVAREAGLGATFVKENSPGRARLDPEARARPGSRPADEREEAPAARPTSQVAKAAAVGPRQVNSRPAGAEAALLR